MAVLLLFSGIFAENSVAIAHWEDDYSAYLNSLDGTDDKDWYFGEKFLNLSGAKTVVNSFLSDPNFDAVSLKADPIVIAVIDSGIGFSYTLDGTTEIGVSPSQVYTNVNAKYKLHSIFDNVLLKDKDGNYVYKNFATTYTVKEKDAFGNFSKVVGTYSATTDSGDIALDMVDNTTNDHGTHCTGIVAMLIHLLGLEDYVKILPIKANNLLFKDGTKYTAGYNNPAGDPTMTKAIQFALDNGADIVNLSLSAKADAKDSYDFSQFVSDMVLVAAAGNTTGATKNVAMYPAANPDVIGVMNYNKASSATCELSSTSIYGNWYDVAAPGTGVISSVNGSAYAKLSGTSMATPIVSVASALAYFRYRGYNNYGSTIELTPKVIRNMISHGCSNKTTSISTNKQVPALKLTDVLSYNYYGDVNFLAKILDPPTGVEITSTVSPEYKLGQSAKISLTAKTTPTNSATTDNLYWWYEKDGVSTPIGYGWTVDFDVPSQVGMYLLKCAIVDEDNVQYITAQKPLSFSVVYAPITDLKLTFNGEVSSDVSDLDRYVMTGDTHTFTLPLNNLSPALTYDVVWYVNGEVRHHGDTFDFIPTDGGTYDVVVKVNGVEVDSLTVSVIGDIDPQKLPPAAIAGIVIAATGGVAGVILLAIYIAKHIRING